MMTHNLTVQLLLMLLTLVGYFASPAQAEQKSLAEVSAALEARYGNKQPTLWGEHLPGVITRLPENASTVVASAQPSKQSENKIVALTLDACDGRTDMRIIALLKKYQIPSTVFVTNSWLHHNEKLALALAKDSLFSFGCHGSRHKPASVTGNKAYGIQGTGSIRALVEEVEGNARAVYAMAGIRPSWYRSGTAFYDEVAVAVIQDLSLSIAGYTISADEGATLSPNAVKKRLLAAPDKAIVLCHLNHPESGTYQGLAQALPIMLAQGVRFVSLDAARSSATRENIPPYKEMRE